MLWDTAGQEEFDALTSGYYRGTIIFTFNDVHLHPYQGAGAAVIVFSTVDRDSFKALESWKRKIEDECGPIPIALVQNKIDLIDSAVVEPEEVEDAATKLGARLYRTCVKDNTNVNEGNLMASQACDMNCNELHFGCSASLGVYVGAFVPLVPSIFHLFLMVVY
jgi:Ras-related protein Rab-23